MTINELYNLVSYVAQKDRKGHIAPNEFNLLVKQAQWEYIVKAYDPEADLPVELHPFLTTTQLQVVNGVAEKPADYVFPSSMIYRIFKSAEDIQEVEVDILDNKKYTIRNGSALKGPTRQFPICTFYGDKIKFAPLGIGQVKFDYIRKPVNPYWDFDFIDDINGSGKDILVFKPNGQAIDRNQTFGDTLLSVPRLSKTVELELPEITHNKIALLMLQNIGVNIDNVGLVQFANAKANENK